RVERARDMDGFAVAGVELHGGNGAGKRRNERTGLPGHRGERHQAVVDARVHDQGRDLVARLQPAELEQARSQIAMLQFDPVPPNSCEPAAIESFLRYAEIRALALRPA